MRQQGRAYAREGQRHLAKGARPHMSSLLALFCHAAGTNPLIVAPQGPPPAPRSRFHSSMFPPHPHEIPPRGRCAPAVGARLKRGPNGQHFRCARPDRPPDVPNGCVSSVSTRSTTARKRGQLDSLPSGGPARCPRKARARESPSPMSPSS
ncbi:hypothetical protein BC628DRAFT_714647 [Trametes gibbosa]|nr:hypothetical protein BC628DRAFT_714647 [Trametes gibbosa]